MTTLFSIEEVNRWTEYNEYEGDMIGRVGAHRLNGYLCLPGDDFWKKYEPGQTVPVEITLERTGAVVLLDSSASHFLRHLDGVRYQVAGIVRKISGEIVWLDSEIPLPVDLDITPRVAKSIPRISVGDCVCVVGTLKIDPDPPGEHQSDGSLF